MAVKYVTRSEINPQRFMASVTTPQGRSASIFVEPNKYMERDDSSISLWISVEPLEKGSFDSEYEAACMEEEALDDRLHVIALGVGERLGASEEGVLEALREGLALVAGRDVGMDEIGHALNGNHKRIPETEASLEEGYTAKVYEMDEKTRQYRLF